MERRAIPATCRMSHVSPWIPLRFIQATRLRFRPLLLQGEVIAKSEHMTLAPLITASEKFSPAPFDKGGTQ